MSENVDRLQALADEARGLFREEASESQRMKAAGALIDLLFVVIVEIGRVADGVVSLAERINGEEIAHAQLSLSKIADALEVIAELERRRTAH